MKRSQFFLNLAEAVRQYHVAHNCGNCPSGAFLASDVVLGSKSGLGIGDPIAVAIEWIGGLSVEVLENPAVHLKMLAHAEAAYERYVVLFEAEQKTEAA